MSTELKIKKVLIAPLDWGLGHATRCIPLIKHFRQLQCEVFIAATESQQLLLENEVPHISFLPIHGYNVEYTKEKRWLALKILLQLPKILKAIKKEHRCLNKMVDEFKIDLVISDNRYGMYSYKIPCIFLTHQLQIKASYRWLESLIQKMNYRYINHFTQCWVPDFESNNNIAGSLSHPQKMPGIPVKYIGSLSRFKNNSPAEIKYQWLVILSGPEPQRTIFENKILKIVAQLKGEILLVRGKPASTEILNTPVNCKAVNHLTENEMQQAFAQSNFIISRSGYTTVMEILSMQKKSILIPTPGQTEQEYLAQRLMNQHWCYSFKQEDDFLYHINKAMQFNFNLPAPAASVMEKTIDDFLAAY